MNPIPAQTNLREGFSLDYSFNARNAYPQIKGILNNHIASCYGDQDHVLRDLEPQKVAHLNNFFYICEVLFKHNHPVGFIVYNNEVQKVDGLTILKMRHLELFNVHDAGSGYRSMLLGRIDEIARERFANRIEVLVHVKDEVRSYLRANDFLVGKYDLQTEAGQRADRLYKDLQQEELSRKREPAINNTVNTDAEIAARRRVQLPPAPKPVTLKKIYIDQIRSGKKTVEGRIDKGMFQQFREGDRVRFFAGQEEVICKIIKITKYKSFPDMLKEEGFKACLPESPTFEQACREYDVIPNYTSMSKEHGVLGIKIQKI